MYVYQRCHGRQGICCLASESTEKVSFNKKLGYFKTKSPKTIFQQILGFFQWTSR